MRIRIRDWDKHFERDRSKQWKRLSYVPVPNKQGSGYRRIMAEKNGLEIYGCWNSILQVASLCEVRGDMTKYELSDISRMTLISEKKLSFAISYLSQVLDWIEVIENLDTNVKNLDICALQSARGSTIQYSRDINLSSSESEKKEVTKKEEVTNKSGPKTWLDDIAVYQAEAKKEWDSMIADDEWMFQRQKYHPYLNVVLSIEKAFVDYWLTEAGWTWKKHRARKSKNYKINWRATIINAITMKSNQVFKDRSGVVL